MGKRIKCCSRIFNHVPAEIIEEILYKLPVKSLLRFKCVSKSWRCSISSKSFVREHLNKSNSGTDFANHNLIFTSYQPTQIITGSGCIGPLLNDGGPHRSLPSNSSIPIPSPALEDNSSMRNSNKYIDILGSCNGLILISVDNKEMYLWNPSTRKANNILNASFPKEWERNWHWGLHHSRYGFGYIESTDDYKVVLLKHSPAEIMCMYSSRTDSWKEIRNFDQVFLVQWPATFVNGRLHWLKNKVKDYVIVSLDLVDEKYQIVHPPHFFSDYDHPLCLTLGDLGGYLTLICYDFKMLHTVDVWVMKNESWSKTWTFSHVNRPLPTPLWLKKNGDILVTSGSDLVVYHEKDKLRQSQIDNFGAKFRSTIIIYVESLVSPFGDDEHLRQ